MRSLQINVASTESSAARTRPRMYALFALVVQRLGGVSLFDKGAWDGLQTDIFNVHASSRTPPRSSRQLYMSVPGAWPDEQCLNSGRFGMGASICDMRNPLGCFRSPEYSTLPTVAVHHAGCTERWINIW